MDEAATTYAVPYEWRTSTGFGATDFTAPATARPANERRRCWAATDLRHISCHLGGSSSVAAFRNGVAVDTSLGASPQSGLPQNNRVGDIDVFAVLHMMKKLGLDADQMAALLGSKVGTGGDQRRERRRSRPERGRCQGRQAGAACAGRVCVRAIRHYVGAFLLELGGLDAITFSGGIGENSAEIRAAVLKGLALRRRTG
jgi:acetate kinase